MKRESQNNAHGDHSGMCRNHDIGIDCNRLQDKSSQPETKRAAPMSRHFGISFYRPNDHYMRGPGPACAKNARNILKSNARPASPFHAPAGDAGPPFLSSPSRSYASQNSAERLPSSDAATRGGEARFVLSHAEFLAHMESGSQALQNLRTTAFSFLALGLVALPFFLGAVVYALFFAPSVASVF